MESGIGSASCGGVSGAEIEGIGVVVIVFLNFPMLPLESERCLEGRWRSRLEVIGGGRGICGGGIEKGESWVDRGVWRREW